MVQTPTSASQVVRFGVFEVDLQAAELRKNGALAYMQRLLAEKNIHFVARHHEFGPFHLWLSKPITKPDLTGFHLRVAPVYTAFFKSLGATVQRSNIAQVYTYMENGTVQGYGWPALAWVPAWIKVTKYRVEPGFYSATLHTLVNLKRWNKLSNAEQAVITKVGLEFEAKAEPNTTAWQAKSYAQKAWMAEGGMKTITFEGADRAKWLAAAKKTGWDEVLERSPVRFATRATQAVQTGIQQLSVFTGGLGLGVPHVGRPS